MTSDCPIARAKMSQLSFSKTHRVLFQHSWQGFNLIECTYEVVWMSGSSLSEQLAFLVQRVFVVRVSIVFSDVQQISA
jgi:hypothetical protein